jgi:hypothetical protein
MALKAAVAVAWHVSNPIQTHLLAFYLRSISQWPVSPSCSQSAVEPHAFNL